jgi:hypothetical protein
MNTSKKDASEPPPPPPPPGGAVKKEHRKRTLIPSPSGNKKQARSTVHEPQHSSLSFSSVSLSLMAVRRQQQLLLFS